jgi:hypothetical protein
MNAHFVVSLRDHLPNGFHNTLKFFHGPYHAALDQLELGADGCPQLLQCGVVCVDVLDRVRSLGELAEEVILGSNGMEEDREVLGETTPGREECCPKMKGRSQVSDVRS